MAELTPICEKHGCEKRYMGMNFIGTREIWDCMSCSRERSIANRALYEGFESWQDAIQKLRAENERLKAQADKLAEALKVTINRYADMNGGFFDEECNRLKQALTEYRNNGG